MQAITVTDGSIQLTYVTDPLISVFGNEMRPSHTSSHELSWDEISEVWLAAYDLDPDGERWTTLTVEVSWGHGFEVHTDAEGFDDAVEKICRRSGQPVPEQPIPTAAAVTIWQAANR